MELAGMGKGCVVKHSERMSGKGFLSITATLPLGIMLSPPEHNRAF